LSAKSVKLMRKQCDDCEGTGHEIIWVWKRFNINEGEEERIIKEEYCAACEGMGYTNDD